MYHFAFYLKAPMTMFLTIFRRFTTTFRRLTKKFPNVVRRPHEGLRTFPRIPKVSEDFRVRPRLYGENLSRVEGSPALPSQLLTTVYMSKVVPVDRVKVNPTKLFIDPA